MRCLLIGLIFLIGSSASAAELNIAPLLHYSSDDQGYTCHVLGPLLEFSSDHTAIRPLFYKQSAQLEVLYPLGSFSEEESRFLPLYRSRADEQNPHTDLFPVFWGADEGRRYGGVFPLYGTLRHRYGRDEIRFVLWPLYSASRTGDERRYSVLWPIFTYSPARELKVFPLYGEKHSQEGKYQYFLWPIFHRERGPQAMDAALPLFLSARGEQNRTLSVLWPLFTYNRDDERGHTSMDMPWPLVRYATGACEERRFFPLYWSKTEGLASGRKAVLWPLYTMHYEAEPENGYNQRTTRILILSSLETENKDGQNFTTLHIWPVFYASKDPDSRRWRVPNLIPLSDEGFQRNWAPLLTLAYGEKTQDTTEVDILWHTLSYRSTAESSRTACSFLFSYENGTDFRQVGFISDLLKIKWLKSSGKKAD